MHDNYGRSKDDLSNEFLTRTLEFHLALIAEMRQRRRLELLTLLALALAGLAFGFGRSWFDQRSAAPHVEIAYPTSSIELESPGGKVDGSSSVFIGRPTVLTKPIGSMHSIKVTLLSEPIALGLVCMTIIGSILIVTGAFVRGARSAQAVRFKVGDHFVEFSPHETQEEFDRKMDEASSR